jgi:glycosyltransferase involved in cell wall biosynthesis
MISVLVPSYKNADKLKTCLDALNNQTLDRAGFEVIVIDNAPSTDTKEVCEQFPLVRYFIETNPGSYAARNKGLKESLGDIIAFTDSDCIVDPDWLRNAKEVMDKSCTDLLAGRINILVTNSQNVYEVFDKTNGFKQFTYFSNGQYGATANLFAKKETFEKYGMFDDTLFSCGDKEFCQRVVDQGGLLSYSNNIVVNHPARTTFNELFFKRVRIAGGKSLLKKPVKGYEYNVEISRFMNMKLRLLKRILKSTSNIFYKLYRRGLITTRRRI